MKVTKARKAISIAVLAGSFVLALASGAQAAVAAAGPGATQAGFSTPLVLAVPGAPIYFSNADLYPHNLVAADAFFPKKKAKAPWCERFPKNGCPRFWSETVTTGGATPVEGVDQLAAGQYEFVCNLHPNMKGTLIVP